jgi:DNA repair protein RadC
MYMGKLKGMPEAEQPYEKCKASGPSVLTDSELLAVFIRTGTREEDPIRIARRVLQQSGKDGLVGLMQMNLRDLMSVKGIGEVKAIQLLCLTELSKRIARQQAAPHIQLDSPGSIAGYYMEQLRHEPQEQVWVCLFDTKCNLICDRMLSEGTVNASLISPREIFQYALKNGAVFFVLVHNHPSGDPTPSAEDVALTRRVADAGAIMNIRLMDHIIIGDRDYTSLKEIGLINE